jgi:nucleoid-associated protein YgaU
MSNGARLAALLVVVSVAAIGLYFAFMTPSASTDATGSSDAGDTMLDAGALAPATAEPAAPATGPAAAAPEAFAGPSRPIGETIAPAPVSPSAPDASGASAPAPSGTASATAGGSAPITVSGAPAAGQGRQRIPEAPTLEVPAPVSPVTTPRNPAGEVRREYVIKSGDTLEGIARTQLGSGSRWREITAMNPGLEPTNLKIGARIMLPDAAGAPKAAQAPESAPAPGAANTYTVQRGDTLVALSRKFYGSDADWKRILEANAGLLKGDPAALKPGMKLTIPAKR